MKIDKVIRKFHKVRIASRENIALDWYTGTCKTLPGHPSCSNTEMEKEKKYYVNITNSTEAERRADICLLNSFKTYTEFDSRGIVYL